MPTKPIKTVLSASKRMVLLTSGLFFLLMLWNTFSSIRLHQSYQESLMDSISNSVLSEYQENLTRLRLAIEQFQLKHREDITYLNGMAGYATESSYMQLLEKLQQDIPDTKLFAIVDNQGNGVLKHITGDFLPDCQEEIASTITLGTQEHLFLHHSATSVHFDLLQPLASNFSENSYFFVAFKPTVLEYLMTKYQLPYQELFLLRADNVGKIELTTVETEHDYPEMLMKADELAKFSYLKAIPGTRWQLAIRLAPEYTTDVYIVEFIKAIVVWLLITLLIYTFYRLQNNRIKSQLQVEKKLAFKESHDALTGLINRAEFEQQLNQFIYLNINSEQKTKGIALLIDIDQFQLINNSFGYSVGDRCLYLVSLALKQFLPDNAVVSRLGNDEFAILLADVAHNKSVEIAEHVRQSVQNLSFYEIASDLKITASVAVLNLDEIQRDVEQIFNALSHAVGLAKQKGRNRIQLYQSNDEALIVHAQNMLMVREISEALKDNRFVLYRQIVKKLSDTPTRENYEVLVRMKDKSGTLKPPIDFIPAAEKYGLIIHIDKWVIKATFSAIAQMTLKTDKHYGINISGVSIADNDFCLFVLDLFEKFAIDPSCIGFEITETAAITNIDSAMNFISKLSAIGCHFSLDDFGSGISSFNYLQQLPVHTLKIDGSFICDICDNQLHQVFVETIQRIAKEMNKTTIAEFVESAAIEQKVKSLGIDFAQGYHIHKPEFWFEYTHIRSSV